MPITITDSNGHVETKYRGEVVEVRKVTRTVNHSDTLDYSDFRSTECTDALVYVGRFVKQNYHVKSGEKFLAVGAEIPVADRFQWLNCTNLFCWRGSDHLLPSVDEIRHPDVVIDYVLYCEAQAEIRKQQDAKAALNAAKAKKDAEDREKNRPTVGKRMVVVSGRKVSPGTVGTVAYIHSSGRVLLKDDDKWQDRKAQGSWVDARHLRAR